MTVERFREADEYVYRFADAALVVCPRCERCASITTLDTGAAPFQSRKLTCGACGHSAIWSEHSITRFWGNPPVDDYFHQPLWLQTQCCGHVLWAYNWEHLDLLERYVAAKLRERRRNDDTGWSNRALVSRLPQWIKAASNREAVLAAIATLRNKRHQQP